MSKQIKEVPLEVKAISILRNHLELAVSEITNLLSEEEAVHLKAHVEVTPVKAESLPKLIPISTKDGAILADFSVSEGYAVLQLRKDLPYSEMGACGWLLGKLKRYEQNQPFNVKTEKGLLTGVEFPKGVGKWSSAYIGWFKWALNAMNEALAKEKSQETTEQSQSPKEWTCPNCNHHNTQKWFYCEKCGTRNIATYG